MYVLYCMYFVYCTKNDDREKYTQTFSTKRLMNTLPADAVRRIEDAAAALITAGNPNPTNDQVRAHLAAARCRTSLR